MNGIAIYYCQIKDLAARENTKLARATMGAVAGAGRIFKWANFEI